MISSRRNFLKRGTLVALAAGVPLGLSEKTSGKGIVATPPAGIGLSKAAFEAQLNTNFLINEDGSKVAVKLVEVADLRPRKTSAEGKEAFSLLFRGDHATALKQNTYLIEHQKLGLFSFLIVPVMTRDKRAPYYEAIINRLNP